MSGFLSTVGTLFRNAAPWISTGLSLLSTVKSFEAANQIENEGQFNRATFEAEAVAVWRSYQDRADILYHEQNLFTGAQTANYAKSGVALQGSAMEVLNDITYRQNLDQRALFSEGKAEATSRLNKGSLAEWQAYQSGAATRTNAIGNLGSTLLNASGRVYFPTPWTSSDTEKVEKEATT